MITWTRVVVMAAIGLTPALAQAERWGFDWHCISTSDGTCAQPSEDGSQGPFGDEGTCEWARTQQLLYVNGPGNLGTTSECHDLDSADPGAPRVGPVRPAHVSRIFLGAIAGDGYTATYAGGTVASAAHQVGGQVEVVFGTDRIGFGLVLGATRDEGTAPDAATGVEPLWLGELGIGLVTAPFPIVRRRA